MKKRTAGQWQSYFDKLFGKAIRGRGRCEHCGKVDGTLQTSHIYSRNAKETRWYLENALCFCAGCHFWWHQSPVDATEWLKKYYGIKRYEALKKCHRITKQWSEQDYLKVEQILIEEIQNNEQYKKKAL